jgi:hypothetical protein
VPGVVDRGEEVVKRLREVPCDGRVDPVAAQQLTTQRGLEQTDFDRRRVLVPSRIAGGEQCSPWWQVRRHRFRGAGVVQVVVGLGAGDRFVQMSCGGDLAVDLLADEVGVLSIVSGFSMTTSSPIEDRAIPVAVTSATMWRSAP